MRKYLVVGRGLVGSELAKEQGFEAMGHHEFLNMPRNKEYDGYVCAAALSSEKACQEASWTEVVNANVNLPLAMLREAEFKPLVVLSTSGVYRSPGKRWEYNDVEPRNRYTASKIFMEDMLRRKGHARCYIFRVPFICLFTNHKMDMENRVSQWERCEAVETSIVYRETLFGAIKTALSRSGVPHGVYNIMSEDVFLPTFVKKTFNWDGEVVAAHSMGRTPSTRLDTTKAQQEGLI